MTLLEFYKYPESCWKTMFASVSNKAPTLKELQAKCDILLADNRIELKNKKEKDGSESNYEKIKACLPKVSDKRLVDLLQLVESIVNEKTSPDTKL